MASEPLAATVGASTAWTGQWLQLAVSSSALMQQTPNGTTLFVSLSGATQNNAGVLYLTSGGAAPVPVSVPALVTQPGVLIQNWQANNLSVSNQSSNQQTPIWIALYGPGIPGQQVGVLPVNGTAVTVGGGMSVQGTPPPQYMALTMQCLAGTYCVFGLGGGRPDPATGGNGYVFSVNDSVNGDTGPGTGKTPPAGYYATAAGNSYKYTFNAGSSLVYVANLSSNTAVRAQISLAPL
jgi:hypothetical protein